MPSPRLAALLVLGLATLSAAAEAAPLDTSGASQCQVRGFSTDFDPKGTNVRGAPRADAPIIGRLAPPVLIAPNFHEGVEFEIVGSKDGWLLIQKPDPQSGLTLDAAHAADGRGWISGKLVSATPGRRELRTAPNRDASLVADLYGPGFTPASFGVMAVHGCRGRHVDVTLKGPSGKPMRGWILAPCSNQRTTCDNSGAIE
jgi:hypothetical protein